MREIQNGDYQARKMISRLLMAGRILDARRRVEQIEDHLVYAEALCDIAEFTGGEGDAAAAFQAVSALTTLAYNPAYSESVSNLNVRLLGLPVWIGKRQSADDFTCRGRARHLLEFFKNWDHLLEAADMALALISATWNPWFAIELADVVSKIPAEMQRDWYARFSAALSDEDIHLSTRSLVASVFFARVLHNDGCLQDFRDLLPQDVAANMAPQT